MCACCNPTSPPEVLAAIDQLPVVPLQSEIQAQSEWSGPHHHEGKPYWHNKRTSMSSWEPPGKDYQVPALSNGSAQGSAKSLIHSLPDLSGTASSLLASPPVTSTELRRILMDFRSECVAATVRQEEFFKQILDRHRDLQEVLATMRYTGESQANAQITLKQCQEDLLAEFRHVSKSFVVNSCADREITPQIANAANGATTDNVTNREIPPQNAAAGMVKFNDFDEVEDLVSKEAPGNHGFDVCSNEDASCPTSAVPSSAATTPKKSKSTLAFDHFESEGQGNETISERAIRILKRKEFEFAIAFALLCNCLVMCWESQYAGLDVGFRLQYPGRLKRADLVWTEAEAFFAFFDWAFGILFLCECLIKLACFRHRFFCDGWNNLDFLCVLAFLLGKIAGAGFKPHMLRLLRLFRLARLVRLIRFLESLEALYVMTTAIAGMTRVLAWAISLLTIMLLSCDLALVQLLHATYFSEVVAGDLTKGQLEKHHQMYAYFGTCTRCMLSMFEITLGNWPPIARLLSEEVSEWFTLLCLIHKLTIGFAVVGVITGVILQETFKVAQTDDIIMLRQKKKQSGILREKLRNLFDALDTNADEIVTFSEFERICTDPNIKTWLASLDVETDDLPMLFHLVDFDGDGNITPDEMLTRMPRIRGTARSIDVMAMHERMKTIMA